MSAFVRHFAALVAVLLLTISSGEAYTYRLVGGRPNYDYLGNLVGYYTYADARAVVTPPIAFSIYTDSGSTVSLYDSTNATFSSLTFGILSRPVGSTTVTGTSPVNATSGNSFVLSDIIFDYQGKYNVWFNASLRNGDKFVFNQTFNVNRQPDLVALTRFPSGNNGSVLVPSPEIQMTDLLGNSVASRDVVAGFLITEAPPGGVNVGTKWYSANTAGAVVLNAIKVNLPGTYSYRIVANLTDGTQLFSTEYQVVVAKAPPTRIVIQNSPTGIAGFLLYSQPIFRTFDSVGPVQDDRTNVTLSISYNAPSFVYEGESTSATLFGNLSVAQVDYSYTFFDLYMDKPGTYEIAVTVYMNGNAILISSFGLSIEAPPTYLIQGTMQINAIGVIQIYGSTPATTGIYLKIADNEACTGTSSAIVPFPAANGTSAYRTFNIVPYIFGNNLYLCMTIAQQNYYTVLVQYYLPSFNEQYPKVLTFSAADVSTCNAITGTDAALYKAAGWTDIERGRQYGCKLTPPVSGTVAPCTCDTIYACDSYSKDIFEPPGLDIGRCVCCETWVLGVAGSITALFLLGVVFVIYMYV